MTKTKQPRKSSGRHYALEISERQAQLISNAVELYARMGLGQFEMLNDFFWKPKGALEQAREHLDSLRLIKNGSLNSHPGIASDLVDDEYRILFDLHRVIRHRLAWDRDPQAAGWKGVAFDTPRQLSKSQDLAKIAQVVAKGKAERGRRPAKDLKSGR